MIGVYKILNKITGKFYIGSSVDIENRFKQHKADLNTGVHNNKYLQNVFFQKRCIKCFSLDIYYIIIC